MCVRKKEDMVGGVAERKKEDINERKAEREKYFYGEL